MNCVNSELAKIFPDLQRLTKIPKDAIPEAVAELERIKAELYSRLAPTAAVQKSPPQQLNEGESWLTVKEACAKFKLTPRWFYNRTGKVSFIKKVSRKKLLINEAGLQRWLASRN